MGKASLMFLGRCMKNTIAKLLLRCYLRITEFLYYSAIAFTATFLFEINSFNLEDIIFVVALIVYICTFAAISDIVRSKFKGELE